MGLLDRDYYRDDSSKSFGGGRIYVTLIIVNVLAFVIQLATRVELARGLWAPGWFENLFILDPDLVAQGQVWRLLTHAFLHDTNSLSHILFNMLFLWWFGRAIEEMYGQREFLAFCLLGAFLAGLGYFIVGQLMPDFRGRALGASGMVSAVMVVYAMHYPRQTVLLFFVLPIPIWLFVGFAVFKDFLILTNGIQTRVAVAAHLSGALFGLLYVKTGILLTSWWGSKRRPKTGAKKKKSDWLKLYDEDPDDVPAPMPSRAAKPAEMPVTSAAMLSRPAGMDEQLEARMDEILDKVQKQGRDSLNDGEKEVLRRASEAIRRRLNP